MSITSVFRKLISDLTEPVKLFATEPMKVSDFSSIFCSSSTSLIVIFTVARDTRLSYFFRVVVKLSISILISESLFSKSSIFCRLSVFSREIKAFLPVFLKFLL